MTKYKIGVDVYCADGRCGKLTRVVIDPYTKRITHLVVEKGYLQKKDRVIPVTAVEEADEDRILLNVTSEALKQFPEYHEEEFTVPTPDVEEAMNYARMQVLVWATLYGIASEALQPMSRQRVKKGIDPEEPVIGRGTKVFALDGPVGEIDHVLVDRESGEITHLVVRKGILPRHVVVPMTLVSNILDDGVYLKADRKRLEELSSYTPRADEDILAEVQDRLAAEKEYDLSHVHAEVKRGVVRLSGYVKDARSKLYAEDVVRRVRGVIDVENALTPDTALMARVLAALMEDPRTGRYSIDVASEHGVITLSGVVPSEEVKRIAEEIAKQQPGVMAVINGLEVNPKAFEHWVPPVVASHIVHSS